jgi:VWFA-related protein
LAGRPLPTSKYLLLSSLLLVTASINVLGQAGRRATPSPTPPNEEQDPVRVFTEEVRLPVIARDQFGHYDPTLEVEDVLVLEDGVAQQVRSIRHLPANVLLLLDTGGELSGLGGSSKLTSLTRTVAIEVMRQVPEETSLAIMQFNNSVELLQPWTVDRNTLLKVLRTKLSSGKRARFSDALVAAAKLLKNTPEGSRHLVLITDGVDTPGAKTSRAEALKHLASARATVHIISYTEFVRQKREGRTPGIAAGQVPTARDPITATDPTLPPGTTRSPSFGIGIRFDPAMRRQRKAYENEIKKSQQALTLMAEETGGRIFLPLNSEEMVAQAREAAREIGSEYVITYRPKRPLTNSRPGEYRRVEVAPRRSGLSLRSRRGYVVPAEKEE